EDRRGNPTNSASYFEGFQGGEPSLGDFGNAPNGAPSTAGYNNDTYDAAQFLGSALTPSSSSAGAIVVNGEMDSTGNTGVSNPSDNADYYAVSLLAGQTVTVQLTQQAITAYVALGIFDPDRRLIATNYSDNSTADRLGRTFQNTQTGATGVPTFGVALNAPITFTADKPGSYALALACPGDGNF